MRIGLTEQGLVGICLIVFVVVILLRTIFVSCFTVFFVTLGIKYQ